MQNLCTAYADGCARWLLRRALTENTRASYPIEHIANARTPCAGPHPKTIILLCCDAFGVLPPISRLTPQQAMYHFISGYSAKVTARLLCCSSAPSSLLIPRAKPMFRQTSG